MTAWTLGWSLCAACAIQHWAVSYNSESLVITGIGVAFGSWMTFRTFPRDG